MTDHGHFAREPDTRRRPLDLPASHSPGLQRASDRPNHWGPFPCGLLGIWRRQPNSDGYLGTRIFEGVVLAIGVVSLIVVTDSAAAIHANSVFYNIAEAGLGIGSLFFCALLFRTGLVPRFLAVWGFIGYACFAGGTLLELSGVAGAGLVGAIPGGLFELTFGIWLIARGFASTPTAVRSRAST